MVCWCLNMMVNNSRNSDMQPIHRLIENIIFTKNGRSYTQSSIDEIQLLHYKVVKKNDLFDNTAVQPEGMTSPETNAELVILYQSDAPASSVGDVDQTIVKRME